MRLFSVVTGACILHHKCKPRFITVKAAGDKLSMQFWWKSYAKKCYILNVWEPIPLKLNRELGQWWKCNKVVFSLIDCASLQML